MKKVLINTNFKDLYTGQMYIAGQFVNMTEERIAEIKAVDVNFVSVVGNADTTAATKTATKTATKPAAKNNKNEKKEAVKPAEETTKPSVEELIEDLEEDVVEEVENV